MYHWRITLFAPSPCQVGLGIALVGLLLLSACTDLALAEEPPLDLSQYAHTAWTIRGGFLKSGVRAIVQTADGYLWLGTEFGLVRFDGVRFVPWDPPQGQHLPSTNIRSLAAARDGTLWIGTLEGLVSWKDGNLTRYPEIVGQNVLTILEDRDGNVWAGTFGIPKAKLCAIKHGDVHCYGTDGSLGQWVWSLYEDREGTLWAGAETGLWRWKRGPPKRYPMRQPIETSQAVGQADNQAGLLVISDGIWKFADDKFADYPLQTPPGRITPVNLFSSRDGALWVGTLQRGILRVHRGRTSLFAESDGLSGDRILSFFQDREGSVWVGTADGLDCFHQFPVYSVSAKQGLSSPSIMSVLVARDSSVWMSTPDGLDRWQNGNVTVYRARADNKSEGLGPRAASQSKHAGVAGQVTEITDPGLPDDQVGSLFEDDRGRIWVSTRLAVARFERGRFSPIRAAPTGWVNAITADQDGAVWISYQDHGLVRLVEDKVADQIPWSQLGGNVVASALIPDPVRGGLWLGFFGGGVVYLKDGRVRASYGKEQGLGGGRVMGLQLDPDGTLWAATEGGLSRVTDGRVATLTTANGLPCETVHWAMEAGGAFWLYTACGLLRIGRSELDAWAHDPSRTVNFLLLDSSDGVRIHALLAGYTPRVSKAPDGKLWFAHFESVSIIDPLNLGLNQLAPPLSIEQITANGKTYDPRGGLRLPPRVRDLAIDYTALTFVAPEKVRFRFRLEGQDKDWREVVNDRRIEYSNLGPGNYRFMVMACNNSGVWNDAGATLRFAIAPAYYQTAWFRVLCVAALLALLWALHQIRIGALQRRQQTMEQHQAEIRALNEQLIKAHEEERTRIAGELHDGVLQQITSLSLVLGAAKRQVAPDSEAKVKIAEVQKKLIDMGTDIRQLSHELHPAVLQESGLPEALCTYCEEFSKTRGIAISCQADPAVHNLSAGAALSLYRIAQEALGNVAKHSQAKHVQIRLNRSDGSVSLSVSDDGVGCTPNRITESGGLGLINMRERMRQLNGTLAFESEPGRGTTITACVPFRPGP